MYSRKSFIPIFIFLFASFAARSQAIYTFLKDDAAVKEKYYNDALADKDNLIKSLGKEHRSDYKQWYESRFEVAADLLKSKTFISSPGAHEYLQGLLQKIVDGNPELKNLKIRMVFTRDGWANAYSIGDGTFAVNAGLFIHLENEAQLVFVLCHELSHLYLDHNGKKMRKSVELMNSDELKKEIKALSRQKYKVGEKLEEIGKRYAFSFFRHGRNDEREADAYALRLMKNTRFDCREALSCLALLEKMNDSTDLHRVDLKKVFDFAAYPFKEKWTKKESSIFSAMSANDASSLTKAEKDSLKTHPDIPERINLLETEANAITTGNTFLQDEQMFRSLQKQFIAEIVEQVFENKNMGAHLFLALQLLEEDAYKDYAAYTVLRTLNRIYQHQKDHSLGMVTDKEARYYSDEYNLLLRMIDRLRLDEIASISVEFARKYNHLSSYKEFAEEVHIAEKNKKEN